MGNHFPVSLNWKNRYNCRGVLQPRISKTKYTASYFAFFWILATGYSVVKRQCNGLVPRTTNRSIFSDIRANRNCDELWLASLSPGDHNIKTNFFYSSAILQAIKTTQSHSSPIRLGEQLQVNINIPPGSGRPALPVPITQLLLPQIYLSSNIFSSRCRSGTPPAAPTLPLW